MIKNIGFEFNLWKSKNMNVKPDIWLNNRVPYYVFADSKKYSNDIVKWLDDNLEGEYLLIWEEVWHDGAYLQSFKGVRFQLPGDGAHFKLAWL